MKKISTLLLMSLAIPFSSAHADTTSSEVSVAESKSEGFPVKQKRFRFYFGGGWNTASYSNSELNNITKSLNSLNASKVSATGEIGFYWRLAEEALLGFNISPSLSTYSYSYKNQYGPQNNTATFFQLPIGVSSMYSFGERIGSGLFARGDVGPTFFSYPAPSRAASSGLDSEIGAGIGAAFTLGYAFPIATYTSILLNATIAQRWGNASRDTSGSGRYSYASGYSESSGAFNTTTFALTGGFLF